MTAEAHGNLAGKHLVIFGCGYLGGEIARWSADRGVRVTALTRNEEKAAALRAAGITAVVAELAGDAWHPAIGGADLVLNCVSSGGGGAEAYRRSYLAGMKSVLAWAEQHGPVGTLVYTSSTSVYPQDGGVRVGETSPVAGRDERSAVLVETEALLPANPQAVRHCLVLRLAGIYGPGRTHLLQQVRTGRVSGAAAHHLNLIHRDDACAAIWAALAHAPVPGSHLFNVADDGAATKAEVTAWLAGRLGVPAPRFTGEPAGGRAPALDRIIVNARLKSVLGWSPRFPTYREGYASLLPS
jgi:nucleoside-diphosphate-sugar epimerase